jgi:predicted nucleotidyltransferase
MNRAQSLSLLSDSKTFLRERYGVVDLALFGSTARDNARPESDVDLLVTVDGPATSERYFGVQFYLEDRLGRPVDLVTHKALRTELRPFIETKQFMSETSGQWQFHVLDMIRFAERALSYTQHLTQPHFLGSGLRYDATVRNPAIRGSNQYRSRILIQRR